MRLPAIVRATMVFAGISMAVSTQPAVAQEPTEKKVFVLPHVLEAIDKAIDQPAPADLSAADQKTYATETAWFKTLRAQLETLGTDAGVTAPRDAASGQASGKRMNQPVLHRADLGAFKKKVELEGRRFNTLSNASKARHDLVMSLIQNLKA